MGVGAGLRLGLESADVPQATQVSCVEIVVLGGGAVGGGGGGGGGLPDGEASKGRRVDAHAALQQGRVRVRVRWLGLGLGLGG